MEPDYDFDVFVSYTRAPPVRDWVENHFHRLLLEWLAQSLPYEPRVFVDWEVEKGTQWRLEIENALKRSRGMVAVLSPAYFRSPWCLAEWGTFRERETLFHMRTQNNPRGIIHPVAFSPTDLFPAEATEANPTELYLYNYPVKAFAETTKYLEFIDRMKAVAVLVARMIGAAPQFADFPLMKPAPAPPAATRQRRSYDVRL